MELGTLESKTLKIVEKLGEASARDVLTEINKSKSLAYTTISTTLERLNKKGFLIEEPFQQEAVSNSFTSV
ncbi:MAG: BlaI/MecI/CopY family transcriptional regulator [Candidatus Bathyarchaeota archaeon]|nr:BlaI/MecI/CopY family transcriptional regulator [Candidatus Bathyarchaeota archaeon]